MHSYLPYARPTVELRESVAALQPEIHWRKTSFQYGVEMVYFCKDLNNYFEIIQNWVRDLLLKLILKISINTQIFIQDFGDGAAAGFTGSRALQ